MPAKHLIVPKRIRKHLLKLPAHVHRRVIISLDRIKANPIKGVKLHGELGDYYKFRIGDYRIVYTFDKKASVLEIVKIEHRQGVYR